MAGTSVLVTTSQDQPKVQRHATIINKACHKYTVYSYNEDDRVFLISKQRRDINPGESVSLNATGRSGIQMEVNKHKKCLLRFFAKDGYSYEISGTETHVTIDCKSNDG
tara:strand:+ start:3660 stop:3986 length:327 start_codon:yes stop_codon:yes gene_type:complete